MPSPTEILPRILILATGGTISGTSDGRSPMGYDAGGLDGDILVNAVPGLAELATLRTEQIANIGSQDMHDDVWASLAERILLACASDEADGFVIIHGTDTMEETAFFLQNVLPHRKPVVLTGAMRPANARSADGTANLFAAVKVAAAPQSTDRGVMMVLNDTIHAARYGSKTHTTDVQTFLSPNAGPLGFVDAASLRFVTPSCPASGGRYRVPDQRPFPKVDIVFAHAGMDTRQIDHAVRDGAKGIILAGVGDGNAAGAVIAALHRARTGGVVVVRASRVMAGWVHRNIELSDDAHGFATSCDLNPQKARILLQLLVAAGEADPLRIQSAFSDMGFHAEL